MIVLVYVFGLVCWLGLASSIACLSTCDAMTASTEGSVRLPTWESRAPPLPLVLESPRKVSSVSPMYPPPLYTWHVHQRFSKIVQEAAQLQEEKAVRIHWNRAAQRLVVCLAAVYNLMWVWLWLRKAWPIWSDATSASDAVTSATSVHSFYHTWKQFSK